MNEFLHNMNQSCHTCEPFISYICKRSTRWRRPIGYLKLQVIFRKRATNHRALLRKMTYEHRASSVTTPPCKTRTHTHASTHTHTHTHTHASTHTHTHTQLKNCFCFENCLSFDNCLLYHTHTDTHIGCVTDRPRPRPRPRPRHRHRHRHIETYTHRQDTPESSALSL